MHLGEKYVKKCTLLLSPELLCLDVSSGSLSLQISEMARACIAITKESPWVVPLVDLISPPPVMSSFTGAQYVLLSTVDIWQDKPSEYCVGLPGI